VELCGDPFKNQIAKICSDGQGKPFRLVRDDFGLPQEAICIYVGEIE
jgi:hypothetical protein